MTTRRAAIYCRVSRDRAGERDGVDRQEAECRVAAEALGWTVVDVYTDNDISAHSGRDRPAYRRMLGDVEHGRIDAILAVHPDRLHRSPRELEGFIALLERHGCTVATVRAGHFDLSTPSGRAVARTLGAWARFEGEQHADRIRSKQAQQVEAGKFIGGNRPFGWQLDGTKGEIRGVVDESEASVVRDACSSILAGESLGSIVKRFNDREIRTANGVKWNYTSLRQVVSRSRNAGYIEWSGELFHHPESWPPLVSEETWRAVTTLLADPSRRRSLTNRAKHLLAGIATCGECGGVLYSAPISTRKTDEIGKPINRTVYRCRTPGRGHVARDADALDELVSEVVIAKLSEPNVRDLLIDDRRPDVEALRGKMSTATARLDELSALFASGDITGAQLRTGSRALREQISATERQMADVGRMNVLGPLLDDDVREAWERIGIDRQRTVIRVLMTVEVLRTTRGAGFRPESIEITWN